jgi:hypothetical protein
MLPLECSYFAALPSNGYSLVLATVLAFLPLPSGNYHLVGILFLRATNIKSINPGCSLAAIHWGLGLVGTTRTPEKLVQSA